MSSEIKLLLACLVAVGIETFLFWKAAPYVGAVTAAGAVIYYDILPAIVAFALAVKKPLRRVSFYSLLTLASVVSVYIANRLGDIGAVERDAKQVVLEIEAERARTGRYPDSVQVVPKSLLERDFRYERDDKGFRIFYYLLTPGISDWYDSNSGWGRSDD